MEMPGLSDTPVGLVVRGYNFVRGKRLDAALAQLEANGITVAELEKSDYRFAAFKRMVDALETCSSNEMMEKLVDYLIAGVATATVEAKPDVFQEVLSRLGNMSEWQVEILVEMQKRGMRDGASPEAFQQGAELENWVAGRCGVDEDTAQQLIVALNQSGFTQSRHAGFRNLNDSRTPMSHRLTGLADLLLDMVYYRHRL